MTLWGITMSTINATDCNDEPLTNLFIWLE
jgi:hypothetical protein